MNAACIEKDVPLAPYTTLGIGGNAEYFTSVNTLEKLREAVLWAKKEKVSLTVIGGGSNVLIDDAGLRGLVIHLGIEDVHYANDEDTVLVTVGAGKELDVLIEELVEQDIWGLENLSSIPGSVGATPVQNVGAYGVEVGDVIASCTVYDTVEDTCVEFLHDECHFSYRNSYFKEPEAKRYIVVWVTFALSRQAHTKLSYNDLVRFFKTERRPSQKQIREAVQAIRSKKFPDWRKKGTAGSFFKNPVISQEAFTKLQQQYPTIPGFPIGTHEIKVPLGFVLDKILGMKGLRKGNVGLYEHQALVLVNHGNATADEVKIFVDDVVEEVYAKTGLNVEWEVTYLK